MKAYLFNKTCTEWQVWVMLFSAFALGRGHVWVWLAIVVVGAIVEGFVEATSERG